MILGPGNFYVYSLILVYLYVVVMYVGFRWHFIPKRQRIYNAGSLLFYILGYSCCILFSDSFGLSFECTLGRKLTYVCFGCGMMVYVLGQVKKVAQIAKSSKFGSCLLVGAVFLKLGSCIVTVYMVNSEELDIFDEYGPCTSGLDPFALYFDIFTTLFAEISVFVEYLIYANSREGNVLNTFCSLLDLESWLYVGLILANLVYAVFSFQPVENPQFYYSIYIAFPTFAMAVAIIYSIDSTKKVTDSAAKMSNSTLTAEQIKGEYERKSVLMPSIVLSANVEKPSRGSSDTREGYLHPSVHSTSFTSLSALTGSNRKLNELEQLERQSNYLSPSLHANTRESNSFSNSPVARRHAVEKGNTVKSPTFILPNEHTTPNLQKQDKNVQKPLVKNTLFKNEQLSIEKKFAEYSKEDEESSKVFPETRKINPESASIFSCQDWVSQVDDNEKNK